MTHFPLHNFFSMGFRNRAGFLVVTVLKAFYKSKDLKSFITGIIRILRTATFAKTYKNNYWSLVLQMPYYQNLLTLSSVLFWLKNWEKQLWTDQNLRITFLKLETRNLKESNFCISLHRKTNRHFFRKLDYRVVSDNEDFGILSVLSSRRRLFAMNQLFRIVTTKLLVIMTN